MKNIHSMGLSMLLITTFCVTYLLTGVSAFTSNAHFPKTQSTQTFSLVLTSCIDSHQNPFGSSEITAQDATQDQSRRTLLLSLAFRSFSVTMLPCATVAAVTSGTVAVIGAGGRTGMEVAQELARQGFSVATLTRTGKDPFQVIRLPPELKVLINHYAEPVNVLDTFTLENALRSVGATAIIYCASASKQGGTAEDVDDIGVGHVAAVAKVLKAKLILISALAVDRPDSKSYQITNTIGGNYNGIMDAKRKGEDKVRSTLKDYVILRPGVLLSGKTKNGAKDMEINQGDTIGGGLSRDELASVAVGALESGKTGITVEVYRTSTHASLQPDFAKTSGNEYYSDSYKGLFDTVMTD